MSKTPVVKAEPKIRILQNREAELVRAGAEVENASPAFLSPQKVFEVANPYRRRAAAGQIENSGIESGDEMLWMRKLRPSGGEGREQRESCRAFVRTRKIEQVVRILRRQTRS